MIRRWSCLIDINNNFDNYNFFNKNYKINLFKTSVNFKRFTYKITKFRRKSLIRIKHKSNWLIYTNILKLWVKDYSFNKHYLRYQFYNKIFLNNFFFYNFNFIKNRSDTLFYNFNFIFSVFTNKNYSYFYKNRFFNFKNTPSTVAWFNNNPIFNNSVLPIYNFWDNNFYLYNSDKFSIFDIYSILELPFLILFKKNIEIKKIIAILFYNHLLKFKNVK